MTHKYVSRLTTIGSDNFLSPGRCPAIIWANAGILLIGSSGTNFNEILSEILIFSYKILCLNVSSAKWRPFILWFHSLPQSINENVIPDSAFFFISITMDTSTGIILCMCPAIERRCYNVMSSLIGWAHTQNDPCGYIPTVCSILSSMFSSMLGSSAISTEKSEIRKTMLFQYQREIGD